MSKIDINEIANAAAVEYDMTKNVEFVHKIPEKVIAFLRFRDYVELGVHDSKNPNNKPSVQCMYVFELLHKKHMLEDNEGNKYPALLTVRLPKGKTDASMSRKLFKKMNYLGKATHVSQLLGDAFLADISHNKSGDKTYANIAEDGAWSIRAPRHTKLDDEMNETVVEVPVPEMQGESRLFLWENPGLSEDFIRAMWQTIYIDGTYTKDEQEFSKNWIQELIINSNDWEGSATQTATNPDNFKVTSTEANVDLAEEPTQPDDIDEEDPLADLGL